VKTIFPERPFSKLDVEKRIFSITFGRRGYEVRGIDPAYEGTDQRVIKGHFTDKVKISADGIILRHVLEHIPNPFQFLSAINKACSGRGIIYIEVPCLEWICEHRAWFDIYYEHVNYFRPSDFKRMFGLILKDGHLFGGQYYYVVADLASLKEPVRDGEFSGFPPDFTASLDFFVTMIKERKAKGRKAFVWGGASKGVIFPFFVSPQYCLSTVLLT